MFGIELSLTQPGGFNLDWMRHVMECMPPAAYLSSEYFDRWYWREVGILTNAGWVSIDELTTGKAATSPADTGDPLPPEALPAMLRQGVHSRRPSAGPPAFKPGDRVRTKFHSPLGVTRLPRYVRGLLASSFGQPISTIASVALIMSRSLKAGSVQALATTRAPFFGPTSSLKTSIQRSTVALFRSPFSTCPS